MEDLSLETIVKTLLASEKSSKDDDVTIEEPFSTNVQLSLGALALDGKLSLWWPEYFACGDNDEPIQIPMVAEDYEQPFGKSQPWVRLPKSSRTAQRDMDMIRKCYNVCQITHDCGVLFGSDRPKRLINVDDYCIVETAYHSV